MHRNQSGFFFKSIHVISFTPHFILMHVSVNDLHRKLKRQFNHPKYLFILSNSYHSRGFKTRGPFQSQPHGKVISSINTTNTSFIPSNFILSFKDLRTNSVARYFQSEKFSLNCDISRFIGIYHRVSRSRILERIVDASAAVVTSTMYIVFFT